jgi:hypothetical protein
MEKKHFLPLHVLLAKVESDRQVAEAVRGRIDWKYTLSLPLEDSLTFHGILSCSFKAGGRGQRAEGRRKEK